MLKALASRNYAPFIAVGIFMSFMPVLPAHSADTDQEKAAANFRLADTNSDNALSKAEFTAFIDLNAAAGIGRAPMVKRNRAYGTAFSRADANGDGRVTPSELQGL